MLIYLHIPKTGGMAVNRAIGATFVGNKKLGTHYDEGARDVVRDLEARGCKIAASHFPWGVHEHMEGPHAYVTVLRHPVERVMSMYAWINARHGNDMEHPGRLAAQKPLQDFCKYYHRAQNGMVRQLSGLGLSYSGQIDPTHVKDAIRNLSRMQVVGVQGRLQAFCDKVNTYMGRATVRLSEVNVCSRANHLELRPDIWGAILQHNEADLRLYEEALRLAV